MSKPVQFPIAAKALLFDADQFLIRADQFMCSGFVQYGFLKAAVRAGLSTSPVIFRESLDERSGNALLAVTPDDRDNGELIISAGK